MGLPLLHVGGAAGYPYLMSKKGHKDAEVREERRRAQFAALQQRVAAEPQPSARREHIQPVDIEKNEQKYEPLLLAIESALVEVYDERSHLPIDDEAERALRLMIARFEGDSERRSGSPDVDAMADHVNRNIETFFRRHSLLSRAEIIGCLRRIISSIATWHTPDNPRAYFDFVGDFVRRANRGTERDSSVARSASGLWIPGQKAPHDEDEAAEAAAPRRPGGLWVPGDR